MRSTRLGDSSFPENKLSFQSVMPVTLATIEQPGSRSADHGGVLIGKSSRSSCPCQPPVSRRSTRSSSENTLTRSTWNLVQEKTYLHAEMSPSSRLRMYRHEGSVESVGSNKVRTLSFAGQCR